MKRLLFLAFVSITLFACNQSATNTSEDTDSQQDTYTYDFSKYGFTLEAPCKMEDVSSMAEGDFLVNYAGGINPNNPSTLAFYQLIVIRFPIGYKDLPKEEFESFADETLKSQFSGMNNLKHVSVGYEGYNGYVGETTHKGYNQKFIAFFKGDYLITLTVISNDNLEAKFNRFTNGFKSVSD